MGRTCCIVGCPFYSLAHVQATTTTLHVFPDPRKDLYRHKQWRSACNNPRMLSKSAEQVYTQYRICRRHFAEDSMNGGCKRLLGTAVPTLHLNGTDDDDDAEADAADDADQQEEGLLEISLEDANGEWCDESAPKRARLDEAAADYTIVEDGEDGEDGEIEWFDVVYEEGEAELDEKSKPDLLLAEKRFKFATAHPLEPRQLADWRDQFYACPKNRLAQNVCSRVDPFEVCISRAQLEQTQHVFTHRVESEGKPMTNQKNSGRCWLFAALNCIRIPFAKHYQLEEFEFSQSYLFYCDKIERCHYFLQNVVETARRGEPVTGRLVAFLLNDPTCDGGQWDMLVNLISKYGLMPKKCFPESFCCESSIRLNAILKSKLREYAKVLRDQLAADESADVQATVAEQMRELYNVIGICLGIPAAQFTWEYMDKAKAYKSVGPVTAVQFYEDYVRQCYNVDDKVVLMTDPRPGNRYDEMYTVDCLGNVVGGRQVLYNNQPVEFLMDMVVAAIKAGEPIWFGCEVSKRFAVKLGIEDLNIHDFKLVFGVDIQTTMSKADRLLYGESAMTHAMVFTAVTTNEDGKPTKFRVENSWGEDRGDKGYLYMSAEWFKEFVFEVVVDRSLLPPAVLAVMDKAPIVLPAWDPMGTLAK